MSAEGRILDDDEPGDRRPAALVVIGLGVLPWTLLIAWLLWP